MILLFAHSNLKFGYNGGLPWGLCKEDLMNFKKRTLGKTVICGARTFQTLPALKGREVIVLCKIGTEVPTNTTGGKPDTVYWYTSLDNVASAMSTIQCTKEYYVIGGSHVLKAFRPYAKHIVVTELDDLDYPCDTYLDSSVLDNTTLIATKEIFTAKHGIIREKILCDNT